MTSALIGHTGFVGGNLASQQSFDAQYNSSNIEEIAGRSFDLVVCAGAPGAKWLANQDPEGDRAAIERLMRTLQRVSAARFVLISTVDVFAHAVGVDETTRVDVDRGSPYGRHRRELEQLVESHFANVLVVRLPGLFGHGLKKNVIFDFLHENRLDRVPSDGVFQFYDLAQITRDIERCLAAAVPLVHFATEPVSVADVARVAFGREFTNRLDTPAPRYDIRTIHARHFGRAGNYIATKDETLERIGAFVRGVRS
ncbi:MAG: pyridine nucleotide transhydrogenase [Planctomycetota bacterium]|nr:pyridine nucleotide transhydrogenase [Planctomycetota bacterium]